MDREQALGHLPEVYAIALRLRHRGATDQQLAAALGIEAQAVPNLLRIAEAKLTEIVEEQG